MKWMRGLKVSHWAALICLGTVAGLLGIPGIKGQTNPPPVMAASLTSTGLWISITNTVTNSDVFEIYTTNNLSGGAGRWQYLTNGVIGQTNFLISIYPAFLGFYRASISDDWDRDEIANRFDADPLSTNVGILTITIETPTNGSSIF